MSSALSGPARRRLEHTMSTPVLNDKGTPSKWGSAVNPGLTNQAQITRSDEILAGTRPNMVQANLIASAAYTTPTRIAALQALASTSRDAWNTLLSNQAGRTIFVKSSGWTMMGDEFGIPVGMAPTHKGEPNA